MTIKISNSTESCEYQMSHIIVSKLCGLTLFCYFFLYSEKKTEKFISPLVTIIVGQVITPLLCSSILTITSFVYDCPGFKFTTVFKSTSGWVPQQIDSVICLENIVHWLANTRTIFCSQLSLDEK